MVTLFEFLCIFLHLLWVCQYQYSWLSVKTHLLVLKWLVMCWVVQPLLTHLLRANFWKLLWHDSWKYLLLALSTSNELMQWRGIRRLSVCLSVCKLLRKSLLLTGKWPDRHQTCTRWTPGQRASRMCSRSRSKVTWCAHFFGFLEWATPSLTVWLICCVSLCGV